MIYDIIVLKNLHVLASTCKREAKVFKNLHSGERFWKDAFTVIVFIGYVWTVGQAGEKKISVFKQNGYVLTGPYSQ